MSSNYDKELTEEVKKLAKNLGAEMVGVGSVERWDNAPLMLSPQGLLPSSKSVITFAIVFSDASMELTEKEISEHWYNPYDMCESLTGMNQRLDTIAFNVSKFLEGKGHKSTYTPVSNLWRIRPYKSIDHPFAPALVHRYAAVACGLGEIGWSGLFLSPEYGSRQRIITLVTEAPLEPTPMYDGPRLCDKCMECVKRCPLDCFRKEVRKINKIDIGGKIFEFPDINKWRCYLDYYGIHGPFIPEKVTEEVAVRIAHSGVKPQKSIMDSGACLCSCVPPNLRFKDEKYPRGIRRKVDKKEINPAEITEHLRKMTQDKSVSFLGISDKEELLKNGIDLEGYLPDGASSLVIGTDYSGSYLDAAAKERLMETIFDISHYLQKFGYATLPIPRLSIDSLIDVLGFDKKNAHFTHLITELPLQSLQIAPVQEKPEKRKISSSEIKEFAAAKGADLTGVSSIDRLNRVYPAIKSLYEKEKTIDIERTWPANTPTGFVKEVSIEEIKVKKPEDYLTDAQSVIVLGIHYPATTLERVAKPPAENIASYVAATQRWGVVCEIYSLVFDIVDFLKKAGYNAEPISDLFGTAHGVNAWGPREGATSSRFAAVCAGLGEIAWSGAVLTPEYGLTQKFVSIVTDAKLEEDPLYQGTPLCKKCFKCVPACFVNAISKKDKSSFKIDNKLIEFGKRDRLKCEWSAKCGLISDAGPKYLGVTKNFTPPAEITAEAVFNALNQLSPVEQSWSATFEKCLSVCPTTEEMLEKLKDI